MVFRYFLCSWCYTPDNWRCDLKQFPHLFLKLFLPFQIRIFSGVKLCHAFCSSIATGCSLNPLLLCQASDPSTELPRPQCSVCPEFLQHGEQRDQQHQPVCPKWANTNSTITHSRVNFTLLIGLEKTCPFSFFFFPLHSLLLYAIGNSVLGTEKQEFLSWTVQNISCWHMTIWSHKWLPKRVHF